MSKKLPRAWEPNEEATLRRSWPNDTLKEVIETLRKAGYTDRTRTAIERKARSLSLGKTDQGWHKSYTTTRKGDEISALEKLDWLPTFDKFETVRSDCVAVCSDMHIPYVDVDLGRKMGRIGRKVQ